MNLTTWPYRLLALAALSLALVVFGWVQGAQHLQAHQHTDQAPLAWIEVRLGELVDEPVPESHQAEQDPERCGRKEDDDDDKGDRRQVPPQDLDAYSASSSAARLRSARDTRVRRG